MNGSPVSPCLQPPLTGQHKTICLQPQLIDPSQDPLTNELVVLELINLSRNRQNHFHYSIVKLMPFILDRSDKFFFSDTSYNKPGVCRWKGNEKEIGFSMYVGNPSRLHENQWILIIFLNFLSRYLCINISRVKLDEIHTSQSIKPLLAKLLY